MANSKREAENEDLDMQGIIRNNNSTEYFCYICNEIIFKQNLVYEHANMNHHVEAIKIFIKYFQITKDVIKCKSCEFAGKWESIQCHAEMHKLILWLEPVDKYKQCFDNFIVTYENQYYCNLCSFTRSSSWHDISNHINDKQHVTLKSLVQNPDDIFSCDTNPLEKYKCVVSNCIVYLYKIGYFYCWICDTPVIGSKNLCQHIQGARHNNQKLTFKTFKRNVTLEDCLLNVPKEMYWIIKAYNTAVFKNNLYCGLCHVTMDNKNAVNNHLTRHLELQGIIRNNNSTEYFCYICNEIIFKKNLAYEHASINHHVKAMEIFIKYFQITKDVIKCKSCEFAGKWESIQCHAEMHKLILWSEPVDKYKQCFDNFIVTYENQYYCNLCSFTRSSSWHDISNHINDKQHVTLKSLVQNPDDIFSCDTNPLEKYKCVVSNCIVYLYKIGYFYCWICDTPVIGSKNLCQHIQGAKHNNQKLNFKLTIFKGIFILEKCFLKIPIELYWIIKVHNIAVFNDSLYCELCNVTMDNESAIENHLIQHTHFQDICQKQCKAELNNVSKTPSKTILNSVKYELLSHLKWMISMHNIQIFPNKLHCKLCNIDMITDTQVKFHLITHFKKCEKRKEKNNIKKRNKDVASSQNTIPSKEENVGKSTDRVLQNNGFVNITFQHANSTIEVLNEIKDTKSYSFDTESIFFTAEEIKSSVYLSVLKENETIYCLICQKDISSKFQAYYDHIFSTEHLTGLITAIQVKAIQPNFTKLALAKQGIKDSTDEFLTCMLCKSKIRNVYTSLYEHTKSKDHELHYYVWMETCLQFYNEILTFIKNNWYFTNKYRCDICCIEFFSEICFAKHINDKKNTHFNSDNYNYHSCISCRLLWYGCNLSYSKHTKTVEHKYMVFYGTNVINKFPTEVETFLLSCEENAEMLLEFSHIVSMLSIKDEILTSLKNDTLPTFKEVNVYAYGSRVCGLGLPDSDINIFLDCSNVLSGRNVSDKNDSTEDFIKKIKISLLSKPEVWDVKEIILNGRTPIMNVWFIPRQLYYKISFKNGLDVESTNLIKRFTEICIPCRKLILILKKWLSFCGISGLSYISNYALSWCVIFYLQRMLILPSISELIQDKNKSKLVDGWRTGVSYNFGARENSELPFKKLLTGFFIFYADFDYRCDIICPLLGKVIERKAFTHLSLLPNDMAPYIQYVTNAEKPKIFCLSPMCVQDPFNLSDNLTAMVEKSTLNDFRVFCSRSVEVLTDSS